MNANIDQNDIKLALGVSSADSETILPLVVDPITNWVMADVTPDVLVLTSASKDRIDDNSIRTAYGVSDTDGVTLIPLRTDSNGNLLATF